MSSWSKPEAEDWNAECDVDNDSVNMKPKVEQSTATNYSDKIEHENNNEVDINFEASTQVSDDCSAMKAVESILLTNEECKQPVSTGDDEIICLEPVITPKPETNIEHPISTEDRKISDKLDISTILECNKQEVNTTESDPKKNNNFVPDDLKSSPISNSDSLLNEKHLESSVIVAEDEISETRFVSDCEKEQELVLEISSDHGKLKDSNATETTNVRFYEEDKSCPTIEGEKVNEEVLEIPHRVDDIDDRKLVSAEDYGKSDEKSENEENERNPGYLNGNDNKMACSVCDNLELKQNEMTTTETLSEPSSKNNLYDGDTILIDNESNQSSGEAENKTSQEKCPSNQENQKTTIVELDEFSNLEGKVVFVEDKIEKKEIQIHMDDNHLIPNAPQQNDEDNIIMAKEDSVDPPSDPLQTTRLSSLMAEKNRNDQPENFESDNIPDDKENYRRDIRSRSQSQVEDGLVSNKHAMGKCEGNLKITLQLNQLGVQAFDYRRSMSDRSAFNIDIFPKALSYGNSCKMDYPCSDLTYRNRYLSISSHMFF